jgi:hypothetical protein
MQSNGGIDLCEELYQQLNQGQDDNSRNRGIQSLQSPLSLQSSSQNNNSKKHSMFEVGLKQQQKLILSRHQS